MLFVFRTSLGVNCGDIRKGEMFKEVSGGIKSEIRKPLFRNTKSPGCHIFNTPQWPTIFLSEVDLG